MTAPVRLLEVRRGEDRHWRNTKEIEAEKKSFELYKGGTITAEELLSNQ
jgi:hypothetical protein